ncbi:uncharacterized protein BX664DRAFT_385012 [Halteromyces radiatus]|uniref:uncharacterized protein n=1 Tax=Halteromyces radiatus TaxID=101107 RepID=UPI00221F7F60|nr:uncharacterized protein BX664DRAFT_385012 [Halteromyces radiatus]KAI8093608.1 hypothetical protein BX664DRAFT_385012 [Halteromyces radiatus]
MTLSINALFFSCYSSIISSPLVTTSFTSSLVGRCCLTLEENSMWLLTTIYRPSRVEREFSKNGDIVEDFLLCWQNKNTLCMKDDGGS